jgi:DNA polymerase/3'-5' exonuclease PolX
MVENAEIVRRLRGEARVLAARGENLFRIRAYRWAAGVVEGLGRPVADMVAEQGRSALEELPGIGRRMAVTIELFVRTGEWVTRSGSAHGGSGAKAG